MDRKTGGIVLWVIAFYLYVVFDVASTWVGIEILGSRELNPVGRALIAQGWYAVVIAKVAIIGSMASVSALSRDGDVLWVYVPTGMVIAGIAVLIFNTMSLLRLTNTIP